MAEITGTWPACAMSNMRVLQASTAAPSMRIAHEPQIIMRQLLRNASVPSCRSLTMSSTSSSVDPLRRVDLVLAQRALAGLRVDAPDLDRQLHQPDPAGAVASTTVDGGGRLDVHRRAEVGELHRQQDVGPHRLVRVRLGRVVELDLAHEAVAVDPHVDRLVGRRGQLLRCGRSREPSSDRSSRGSASCRRRRPSPCRSSSPASTVRWSCSSTSADVCAHQALEVEAELLAGLGDVDLQPLLAGSGARWRTAPTSARARRR